MSEQVRIDVRIASRGTGSKVWDDPHAEQFIRSYIPQDRQQGPMVGILDFGESCPTPIVLHRAVLDVAEDVKVGRYGSFTYFVVSEDEDTRSLIGELAAQRNVAVFVGASCSDLSDAEPTGLLTPMDYKTMDLVSEAGGTVTAVDFADRVGIEKTAAGNRLSSLHKKGYLQRIARPHPSGDVFVDPRSISFPSTKSELTAD